MNSTIDFEQASEYALTCLENQLSPNLKYHSLYHTRDDVLPAAERLATLEGISREDKVLLRTAVLFHDVGFTVQIENHEIISAQTALRVLPHFGYQPQDIQQIRSMILVTKLFTPPQTLLEAIIVDADLDVLGREDYLERNQALRDEIARLGKPMTDEQWYTQQLKFMHAHQYRTISAQSLRNLRKKYNTSILTQLRNMSIARAEGPLNGKGRQLWKVSSK